MSELSAKSKSMLRNCAAIDINSLPEIIIDSSIGQSMEWILASMKYVTGDFSNMIVAFFHSYRRDQAIKFLDFYIQSCDDENKQELVYRAFMNMLQYDYEIRQIKDENQEHEKQLETFLNTVSFQPFLRNCFQKWLEGYYLAWSDIPFGYFFSELENCKTGISNTNDRLFVDQEQADRIMCLSTIRFSKMKVAQ